MQFAVVIRQRSTSVSGSLASLVSQHPAGRSPEKVLGASYDAFVSCGLFIHTAGDISIWTEQFAGSSAERVEWRDNKFSKEHCDALDGCLLRCSQAAPPLLCSSGLPLFRPDLTPLCRLDPHPKLTPQSGGGSCAMFGY